MERVSAREVDKCLNKISCGDVFHTTVAFAFEVSNIRQRLALARFEPKALPECENFTSLIEDVLWVCRRVNVNMSEKSELLHFMKGIGGRGGCFSAPRGEDLIHR